MYRLLIPLIAVGLSACGGGSVSDPNNFITNTGRDVPLPTKAKSFTQTGTGSYSVTAGTTDLELTRTDTKPTSALLSDREYKITVNGKIFALTYNSVSGSYDGSNGTEQMSLFLNENSSFASIINPQIRDTATNAKNQFFGVVGDLTPTGNLPTAMATYIGDSTNGNDTIGEISIDSASGGSDDTTISTVTMDIDFGASPGSQVTGQFSVRDASNDGRGGVEITAPTTPITIAISNGTISGNTFTADLDLTNLAAATTVSGSAINLSSAASFEGGFYGNNAETAAGVGLSLGQISGSSSDDILVYTRVIAKK